MSSSKNNVQFMTESAMIAAIYTVLTLVLAPISYGPVQFRVSEALCVLPYFTSAGIPGLFLGCLISNGVGMAMGTTILPDVVFGSLATLIGAIGSYVLRKNKWLVCIPPIAGQCADYSICSALCIWFSRSDSVYDADGRNRRGACSRCSRKSAPDCTGKIQWTHFQKESYLRFIPKEPSGTRLTQKAVQPGENFGKYGFFAWLNY